MTWAGMAVFLGKLGELTLKGSNKKLFEKQLKDNMRDSLKARAVSGAQVTLRNGRLFVVIDNDSDCAATEDALAHLVGITGFQKCDTCDKNIDLIRTAAISALKGIPPTTFKVKARREDKSFPLNSYELECDIGDAVLDSGGGWRVDVHSPALVLNIEVRDRCYLYIDSKNNRQFASRGLPVGSSGKALVMLSGGLDSPIAAWRLIRRGMMADCVYFESPPYTSIEARKKVETLARLISQWTPMLFLNIIPFTDVQMRIKDGAPQDWVTMMLRVCMMKAANMTAARCHADCIATGESLSQVASQTIDNLKVTEYFAQFPLLRPLIALDKEEIISDSRKIGTYDTSILPYEDCCVLFSPRHPVLKGTKERAGEIFNELQDRFNIESLIEDAYKKRLVIRYSWGKEVL